MFTRSVLIRTASEEDAVGIAKVHVKGWQQNYKGIIAQGYLDSLSWQDRVASWGHFLSKNEGKCYLLACTPKEEIIGFCSAGPLREQSTMPITKEYPSVGEVYAIYLLEDYKNQGIGTLLWGAAVAYLKENHLTPYVVWGLEKNMRARQFYEKKGGILSGKKDCIIGDIPYDECEYLFAP